MPERFPGAFMDGRGLVWAGRDYTSSISAPYDSCRNSGSGRAFWREECGRWQPGLGVPRKRTAPHNRGSPTQLPYSKGRSRKSSIDTSRESHGGTRHGRPKCVELFPRHVIKPVSPRRRTLRRPTQLSAPPGIFDYCAIDPSHRDQGAVGGWMDLDWQGGLKH